MAIFFWPSVFSAVAYHLLKNANENIIQGGLLVFRQL